MSTPQIIDTDNYSWDRIDTSCPAIPELTPEMADDFATVIDQWELTRQHRTKVRIMMLGIAAYALGAITALVAAVFAGLI